MGIRIYTVYQEKRRFYKRSPISITFGMQYTEEICNTMIIDISTSPANCCCITLGKKYS